MASEYLRYSMLRKIVVWVVKKTVLRLYCLLGRLYLAPILLLEWKRPASLKDKPRNERPIEYGFAFKWLAKICPEEVLDVGSGNGSWPHIMADCGFRVTAIDKITGYWKGDFFNRHYHIINDDITKSKLTKEFDFITCLSVLEHIPNHQDAIDGIFSLLKPGGHLVLTFPYNEERYVDNVYELPGAGYGQDYSCICQVFSRKEIDAWLKDKPAKVIDHEYYDIFGGDLWTFGERVYPPCKVEKGQKCHLTCVLIQKS
jgi:SAM-dependent methyltransferase